MKTKDQVLPAGSPWFFVCAYSAGRRVGLRPGV